MSTHLVINPSYSENILIFENKKLKGNDNFMFCDMWNKKYEITYEILTNSNFDYASKNKLTAL